MVSTDSDPYQTPKGAIRKLAGLPVFERPLNGVEPLRIFEGPNNDGLVCDAYGVALTSSSTFLRQQPLGLAVRQVIEQIPRFPQGHDIACYILVNVRQPDVGKQFKFTCGLFKRRARSR